MTKASDKKAAAAAEEPNPTPPSATGKAPDETGPNDPQDGQIVSP